MNKKQIINAMVKTVDLKTSFLGNALQANNDFIFTNGKSMAFFDRENPADIPISEHDNANNLVKIISDIFNSEAKKTISINRKKLDDFIKANKLRNGYGQNINLKCGEIYLCYNAKYLWWIMDYCKSDNIVLVDSGETNHFTAICTGENCKALLLPVRVKETPTENIFIVEDSLAEISEKIKGFKAEKPKNDNKVKEPVKVAENAKTSVTNAKKTRKKADVPTIEQVDAPVVDATKKDISQIRYVATWSELIQKTYDLLVKYQKNKNAFNLIKDMFDSVYPAVQDMHKYASGRIYQEPSKESCSDIWSIITTLSRLKDCTLEMIGRFMWTGGKQKQYASILKSLGFTFQENKGKYCRSYDGYIRHDGKHFSYVAIKKMYGVQEETTI